VLILLSQRLRSCTAQFCTADQMPLDGFEELVLLGGKIGGDAIL